MSFFSEDNAAELRELFFESAQELLQALNEEGLKLEKQPGDAESIRRVRRAVHTLKGDSAACGYRELSELAHELEDLLTPELTGSGNTGLAEVVFTAADTFHAMLAAYRGNLQPPAADALRAHIRGLVQRPGPRPRLAAPAEARFAWSEYEHLMIAEAVSRGEPVYNIALRLDPNCALPAAALQLVRNVLHELGTILALRPDDDVSGPEADLIEAALASAQPPEAIAKKCRIPSVVADCVVEGAAIAGAIEPELLGIGLEPEPVGVAVGSHAAKRAGASGEARAAGPRGALAGAESILRVNAGRIDEVLNLVGELIIGKSMLYRTIHEFDKRFNKDPLRNKLADAVAFQARVLDDLQKSVMKIRMVPVEQLFRRIPRIVRDVAKSRNKDVAVAVSGLNTDLDKSILDALAEPLTHLVRNAVDHGIEPPEERVAAGKPARGTVRLNAYHRGNQVMLEVSDDGRGIDRGKIVARALERAIITAEEAARLGEAEAFDLTFHPGFSTAEEVTEISGRGVGLDVVKSVLKRLKGSATIKSNVGQGTTFLLTVPLTLASIHALLFQVGGQLYAVPLASVVEITRASDAEIHRVDDHEVLQLRNQVLTLVRLDRLAPKCPPVKSKRLFIVVIGAQDRRFGLIVDNLMGEEELVIKALDNHLVANDLVSGASILGDGTVVLILNVSLAMAKLSNPPALGVTA